MFTSILAIASGGSLGCLLRWLLSTRLNGLSPAIPPGTLVANLVGGYLIGVAIVYFGSHPNLSPAWRLFVITGFMGGLTTFSTFSAEVAAQIQQGRFGVACAAVAIHVGGSLAMTLLGMATVAAVKGL